MNTVENIMTDDSVTVTMQDNVYEVAVKMKENDIGFVPVVDGNKLLGVITDRDLVIRGYAEKKSGSTAVEEVMTTDMITIAPHTSIDEAAELMARHQIRRLPVVDNGMLIGVVALADLATEHHYGEEAGEALSQISEQSYMQ